MKKRKFAEGGSSALEDLAEGKDSGRFSSDVYKRALAFRKKAESGEDEAKDVTTTKSVRKEPAAPSTPSAMPAGRAMAGRKVADEYTAPVRASTPRPAPPEAPGEIPRPRASDARAPAESDPEGRMDMSDTGRNIRNIATALTPFGAGAANRAIGSRLTTSGILGAQAGRQDAAVARAAERGAASRAAIRAKREAEVTAAAKRGRASREAVQKKREQGGLDDYSYRRATDMEAGFAKGGSIRGGGCEQRGKTRGRML